jgi:hypothetical protein
MTSRYGLPPAQGRTIEGILPGQAGDRGYTAVDNLTVVKGGRWVLRSDAPWKHPLECYDNGIVCTRLIGE